jgi:hypothetical protein
MKSKFFFILFNVILVLSFFYLSIAALASDKPRIQAKPVKPIPAIEIKNPGNINPAVHSDCVVDTDCRRGEICNGVKRCVEGCRKNADCRRDNYCSDGFKCVSCLKDAHCRDGKVCNELSNQCVECTKDIDCSNTQKCNIAENKCVPK